MNERMNDFFGCPFAENNSNNITYIIKLVIITNIEYS